MAFWGFTLLPLRGFSGLILDIFHMFPTHRLQCVIDNSIFDSYIPRQCKFEMRSHIFTIV